MNLEEKVMFLYEDILGPEEERKIVLLLKYVIIDKETELETIKKELDISDYFIQKNICNDRVMLRYLNHDELKKFKLKMDKMLEKNSKLIKLIKMVLVDNETNVDKITKTIPIGLVTLKKYVEDKSKLLEYLTEDELKLFLSRINIKTRSSKTPEERLIEVVKSGEIDLKGIELKTYIQMHKIKKYIEEPGKLKEYLKEDELNDFILKLKRIVEEYEMKRHNEDLRIISQIIDDILNTRHKLEDICSMNFVTKSTFEQYFYDTEYMEKHFPKGTFERTKAKIFENGKFREGISKDFVLIVDRMCIMITKDDIYKLNHFDYRKLDFAAYYLGTGANLELVKKHFGTSDQEILSTLASDKLKDILKPEYYAVLQECLVIENLLLGNNLMQKKQMAMEVVDFLQNNNFDIVLARVYFRVPECLFNKILLEIIKLPYADQQTKQTIKSILNIETNKKTR